MRDSKNFVENYLPVMDSPEKVYQLFQGLGYKILDPSFHGVESWGLQPKDKDLINNIYTIVNYQKRFQIFLIELKSLSSSIIRNLPLYFEKEVQYPFFVITSNYKDYTFVLVEKTREDVGVWKRKVIKLNLDIANPYYTDKLVISNIAINNEYSAPKAIYNKLREAFSVEKVSKIFFEDYKKLFFKVRQFLCDNNIDIKQAHEFSQQLLNRIMFIYFIDKKGWLKKSPKFMRWFWNRYLQGKSKNNKELNFYKHWINPLFFEAFNNQFIHSEYLPDDVQDVLINAPYLNGGLFKKFEFDEILFELPDNFIENIIKFFEKYNFTIKEDLPLDVEVAIDPQMIGYVYESLANVAEEIYERQDLGIFYTPKAEVDFMCRRSLTEYLYKKTKIDKEIIYRLLFDIDSQKIEKILNTSDYEKLEYVLENLSVLDPACGSGAFLVGMLNVLVETYKIIFNYLQRDMTDYQLKKRIIGNNLYGVDVMPWAVHSAELRLWLSLMIESDLRAPDLKRYPLLPNLNLKLRIGDSLVQELGGINLNIRDVNVSPLMKQRLYDLKREKEKYYSSDPTAKFKSPEALLTEEDRIFNEILDEIIENLTKEKQTLQTIKVEQQNMFKMEVSQQEIFDEKALKEKREKEKRRIDEQIQHLINIKNKLNEKKPFIWDIDFAEIFGEKGGFDIVIGNPPYVRQEKIAPPNMLRSEIRNELKREYKEKLLKSVKAQFKSITKIDKKSDYYIYFYFHGLSLLNRNGTFCFITSNSWLDVGYGKNLQEFLLKYVPITAIYDNQAKRSFEHADVNTIIALFGAPYRMTISFPALKNTARFVMFKKPFDEVVNSENLIQIEKSESVISTDGFRVYPKRQVDLLNEGWEYPDETVDEHKKLLNFNIGEYTGNKWGGKYLRAPDIFFKILEKGKDKLVRLGDIAEVRFGIKTGCNEFFYLPSKHFDIKKEGKYYRLIPKHDGLPENLIIEEEYLKPVIISLKNWRSIYANIDEVQKFAFTCYESRKSLDKRHVLEYIKWGENKKYNLRPSVESRHNWWSLPKQGDNDFIMLRFRDKRNWTPLIKKGYEIGDTVFVGFFKETKYKPAGAFLLNSTFHVLITEIFGRINLGDGLLTTYGPEIDQFLIIHPKYIDKTKAIEILKFLSKRPIYTIYKELGINPKQPIRLQKPNPLPDRKALDDIVFDILKFTQEERDEVYWAVCELVKNRLEKARSI